MTKVDAIATPTGGKGCYMFYMLDPPAGAHNVVIDLSADLAGNTQIFASARSYLGISSYQGKVTATGASGNPSVTVTNCAKADLVVDTVTHEQRDADGTTAGSGQTERYDKGTADAAWVTHFGSDETATGASVVMDWTPTNDDRNWASIGAHFQIFKGLNQVIMIC